MKKLLLVDDSFETRDLLRVLLRNCGYAIYEASSGQEALNVVTDEKFDLIISDLEMPDGDGYWLLEQLKIRSFPNYIIILSGDILANETELKLAGATAFFPKPIVVNKIVNFIKNLNPKQIRRF